MISICKIRITTRYVKFNVMYFAESGRIGIEVGWKPRPLK